jgi:calcineurin-like phosphoesterase family protein
MKDFFYKPLKIEDKEDNIFFWSDMHLGHRCVHWDNPLYKQRGFNTVEEHDAALVKRWNETVSFDSIVFNLGDMLFGNNGFQRLINYFEILNFKTMYLLFGNHTAGTKQVFESIEGNVFDVNSEKQVIFCPNYVESFINGFPCALSHYAIASFNGQSKGGFMIHGHSHGNLYKSELGKTLYQARIIDVGIENCSHPISFHQIKSKFKDKPVSFDHHGEGT